MKYLKLFGITLFFAFFILAGCDSIEDAQLAADEFYEAYNTEDETKMENLLDKESVLDAGIKGDFYNVFDQHWEAFGTVKSYDRYGFSTNTNNGVTTVLGETIQSSVSSSRSIGQFSPVAIIFTDSTSPI